MPLVERQSGNVVDGSLQPHGAAPGRSHPLFRLSQQKRPNPHPPCRRSDIDGDDMAFRSAMSYGEALKLFLLIGGNQGE